MYDYLKELFHHEDESNRLRCDGTVEYRALDVDLDHCHDKISKTLGQEFFNDYWDVLIKLGDIERLTCFRHGFRLAVRLMLS